MSNNGFVGQKREASWGGSNDWKCVRVINVDENKKEWNLITSDVNDQFYGLFRNTWTTVIEFPIIMI